MVSPRSIFRHLGVVETGVRGDQDRQAELPVGFSRPRGPADRTAGALSMRFISSRNGPRTLVVRGPWTMRFRAVAV